MARCYLGHNSSKPKILSYIVRSLKYADARCLLSETRSPVELFTPTPMLPYSEKFQCVSQILPWPGSWSHFHSRRCLHSAFESAADCNDVEKVDLCDALTLSGMLWKAVLSARAAAAVQKWMSDNLLEVHVYHASCFETDPYAERQCLLFGSMYQELRGGGCWFMLGINTLQASGGLELVTQEHLCMSCLR